MRLSVCQTLSICPLDGASGAFRVINPERDPVRVPEIKLIEISLQVFFAAMLIDTDHAALEDREEALNGVGGHVAASVLTGRVGDTLMRGELHAGLAVVVRFIGMQAAIQHDVLKQHLADRLGAEIVHLDGTGATAALDQRNDLALRPGATLLDP